MAAPMANPAAASPPSPSPIVELNARSRDIFRMIVDGYVQTGEPIGSRTISRRLGLNLSPATIRNVMADLEEAGLPAARCTAPASSRMARCCSRIRTAANTRSNRSIAT